jgi:hypothetical protein
MNLQHSSDGKRFSVLDLGFTAEAFLHFIPSEFAMVRRLFNRSNKVSRELQIKRRSHVTCYFFPLCCLCFLLFNTFACASAAPCSAPSSPRDSWLASGRAFCYTVHQFIYIARRRVSAPPTKAAALVLRARPRRPKLSLPKCSLTS